jgi:hypothetical protein
MNTGLFGFPAGVTTRLCKDPDHEATLVGQILKAFLELSAGRALSKRATRPNPMSER